jgi:cobalt-zinc-cadmium efflux system membrane fusion protein
MKKYKLFRISGAVNFFLVLVIIFFQTSCQTGAENKEDDKPKLVLPDSLVKTLEIDSVSSARVINSITLTGKVAFNEEHVVKIFPMVSGNVQDIKVMLGDFVQSGQILAVVRSSEMAGYSNDLVTAETNLEVAKKNLDATNDMYKSGLASARDQLAAEASYNQAQATLEKTQRILQINGGTKNGEYLVKSPIQGFIVEKNVNNNMVIRSDNASNLFTISDLKNVWVLANVYESNIPLIKTGDSVEVKTLSYPDRVFRGKVDKIMNVLDPTNKVMKVRIVLSNPEYLLKPEMFANVTVNNTENKRMVCIPSKALIFDHSQHYVLVYKSASDISIRPVQVANTVGDKSYISEGLNIGEKVIASQAILIYQELNS